MGKIGRIRRSATHEGVPESVGKEEGQSSETNTIGREWVTEWGRGIHCWDRLEVPDQVPVKRRKVAVVYYRRDF